MIDYILLLLKEDREDWNENHGILRDIHAICILHGRLLYYEPSFGFGGYNVIQNNDMSNVELEEVLNLKKQLVDVQPIDVHYLSIATTFIQLGRYLRLTKLMFSKRAQKIEKRLSFFFDAMLHFVTIIFAGILTIF